MADQKFPMVYKNNATLTLLNLIWNIFFGCHNNNSSTSFIYRKKDIGILRYWVTRMGGDQVSQYPISNINPGRAEEQAGYVNKKSCP